MSFLTQFWLQRMTTLANASKVFYYTFLWFLVILGVAFLLLFPIVSLISLGWLGTLIYVENPMAWQGNDWILAASLLATSAYTAWVSFSIFKIKPELPAGKPL
ncbi:MAG: hypothetical protein OQK32_04680, partial [Gammaproteobacteria bacterium]|nr:hypothetical protein [Gammaproteobacteria bacterium]